MTTQPNTPELKPCPFCGSKKIELCDAGDAFYVICRNKGCGCWPFGAEEREVAINTWNTRVGEVQKGEELLEAFRAGYKEMRQYYTEHPYDDIAEATVQDKFKIWLATHQSAEKG